MRLRRPLLGLFFLTLASLPCAACSSLIGADAPVTAPGEVSDAGADVTSGCVGLGENATDIFVGGPAGGAKGTGSRECPFATIGEGLAVAEKSKATAKVVHVGPGRYANEVFPLHVKGGISLVGSDLDHASAADDTIIAGTGAYTSPFEASPVEATIIVGSSRGVSTLQHLTVDGSSNVNARYGVVCDEGPVLPTGSHDPNAILDSIDVHGYVSGGQSTGRAVFVTARSATNGCNLRVLASHIHDSISGIDAVGCEETGGGGPVTLELGDGTAAGANELDHLGVLSANTGWAVRISDCVTYAGVHGNRIHDTPGGIEVNQDDHPGIARGRIEIDDNRILGLTNWGLALLRRTVVAELRRNELRGMTSGVTRGYAAVGIIFDSGTEEGVQLPWGERPRIAHARGNVIVGNDAGLSFRGMWTMDSDFGTVADRGENTLGCNHWLSNGREVGLDVWAYGTREQSLVLSIVGNTWDHAPVVPTNTCYAETDACLESGAQVDTRFATADPNTCAKRLP